MKPVSYLVHERSIGLVKKLSSRYGYFNDSGDFVISDVQTPVPWTQILTNGNFGSVVSQAGSGYSFFKDAQQSLITRWIQDLVTDSYGKYYYIKNRATGDISSFTFMPTKSNAKYSCVYSPGSAAFMSKHELFDTSLHLFVPFEYECEIALLTITNTTEAHLPLSIFTYLELNMGTSLDVHREFHKLFFDSKFSERLGAIITEKHLWTGGPNHWNDSYPWSVFHASTEQPSGYDTDKRTFLGMYGDVGLPSALKKGRSGNRVARSVDAINSLQIDVNIPPSESCKLAVFTGVSENNGETIATIERIKQEDLEDLLERTKNNWRSLLGKFTASVPSEDADMEALLNSWLPYQAIAGRLFARTAYYQMGGAFGYRDQLQDSMATLWLDPEITKKQILKHAEHQREDGTVHHWWFPLNPGVPEERWSDDLLWLPFAVSEYLSFTGDKSILDVSVPFADEGQATIKEHCLRSIRSVLNALSPRGIPLILDGDWNDGLNALGKRRAGESFWMSEFLYHIMQRVLSTFFLSDDDQSSIEKYSRDIQKAFSDYAWNGEWFERATDDLGRVLGGKRDGRVFLNTQNWAVISGISDLEKTTKAFSRMKEKLITDYGPLLFSPPLEEPDSNIGYLSRYAPGSRENGGVYTHAAVWTIIAAAKMNDSELVDTVFNTLSPARRSSKDPDLYRAEPYVLPGNSDGPLSEQPGRAGWTWYTGSAGWLYRSLIEHLIGVKPAEDGIDFRPCTRRRWRSASFSFEIRGGEYEMRIENPNEKTLDSDFSLRFDGKEVKNKTVPYHEGKHIIELVYG